MKTSEKKRVLMRVSFFSIIGAMGFIFMAMNGCETIDAVTQAGLDIGVASGLMTESEAQSVTNRVTAVTKTFEDFTPEQEYYIGRAVGAVVLNRYRAYDHEEANYYVNLLGQTLAQASDLPETFGGYHFLILDSDDINAFAAPGGMIFITRGLIRCCEDEEALAAVLAHEIGHVQLKHGLQAIRTSRVTTALTTLAMEGAKNAGGELAQITQTFEDSISDITSTLINNGYSRSFELEADLAAVDILNRVGYNPGGIIDMLKVMGKKLKPGTLDFAKTHPSPANRIADIEGKMAGYTAVAVPDIRRHRFNAILGGI